MEQFLDANRLHWNELTPINRRSNFYGVEGFRAGQSTLTWVELDGLGDVSGKSLLHLQCHFGLDTLSWARLGARVTGVDFSEEAIALARSLALELEIQADFIHSNLYSLPDLLTGEFDIVFTSYGVLSWLPNLEAWARVISHFLKPGGTFYMAEFHPFAWVFDDANETELKVKYPYFHSPEPLRIEPDGSGSYADPTATITTPTFEWSHSLGDIFNSLISAEMRIDEFLEYSHTVYRQFPFLEHGPDGHWRLQDDDGGIPLMFSLKATK